MPVQGGCWRILSSVANVFLGSLSLIVGMEKKKCSSRNAQGNANPYATELLSGRLPAWQSNGFESTFWYKLYNYSSVRWWYWGVQNRYITTHDGGLVPVKPLPNSLVVDIGNVMEVCLNFN